MKTWLTIAACLLATFLVSDRSFVSGADLQGFEAEEEMSLRAFSGDDEEEEYDDYDDEEEEEIDDDGAARKRRAYGAGNGNLGQPSILRPTVVGPSPPIGGIARPGFPLTQPQPGFPQPGIGNYNPGVPQPPNGNRIPGYPQPPIGGGRPIVGKRCTAVSRGSPHWVPGLDSWCPQNCPTGNCPSHLCVCY